MAVTRPLPNAVTSVTSITPKKCGHHYCQLTIPSCCACTDARPIDGYALMHIDGRGLVAVKGRPVTGYCPACKGRGGKPADQSFMATFHDIPRSLRQPSSKLKVVAPVGTFAEDVGICKHFCWYIRRRGPRLRCCNCSLRKLLEDWEDHALLYRPALPSKAPRFCVSCKQADEYRSVVQTWDEAIAFERARSIRRREQNDVDPAFDTRFIHLPPKELPVMPENFITAVIPGEMRSLLPLPTIRAKDDYRPFSLWVSDDDDDDDGNEDVEYDCDGCSFESDELCVLADKAAPSQLVQIACLSGQELTDVPVHSSPSSSISSLLEARDQSPDYLWNEEDSFSVVTAESYDSDFSVWDFTDDDDSLGHP